MASRPARATRIPDRTPWQRHHAIDAAIGPGAHGGARAVAVRSDITSTALMRSVVCPTVRTMADCARRLAWPAPAGRRRSNPNPHRRCCRRASAVRASGPAARPAHASAHLVDADLDAAFPCGILPGRSNPADPLVSGERRNVGPQAPGRKVGHDGFSKVSRQLVDRAIRGFWSCHGSRLLGANNAGVERRHSRPPRTSCYALLGGNMERSFAPHERS